MLAETTAVISDPIRIRWLILYLGIALECDSPILELFWPFANPLLVLLSHPERIQAEFEKILLPWHEKQGPEFNGAEYYLRPYVWVCTFIPHNNPSRVSPARFSLECGEYTGLGESRRLVCYEIDRDGFYLYEYKVTFRKLNSVYESLPAMLVRFRETFNKKKVESYLRTGLFSLPAGRLK